MRIAIDGRLYVDSNRHNWFVRGAAGREVELDDDGNPTEGTDALGCYRHLSNLITALREGRLYGRVPEKALSELAYIDGRIADAQGNIMRAFATPLNREEQRRLKIVLELPRRFRFHCNDGNDVIQCHRQEPDGPGKWKSKSYFRSLSEAMASTHIILVRHHKAESDQAYHAVGECEDQIVALREQLPLGFFGGELENHQEHLLTRGKEPPNASIGAGEVG